jgi:hypothetical protein
LLPLSPTALAAVGEPAAGNKTGFDPAYAFRYLTADSEREEEGDGRGRVRGHYSYSASPGGPVIRVEYRASPETGFVIENEPGTTIFNFEMATVNYFLADILLSFLHMLLLLDFYAIFFQALLGRFKLQWPICYQIVMSVPIDPTELILLFLVV